MSLYHYQSQLPGVPDPPLEEPDRYYDHSRSCDCRACERFREIEEEPCFLCLKYPCICDELNELARERRLAVDEFVFHEGTDPRSY